MESNNRIQLFLDEVRRQRAHNFGLNGAFLAATVLTIGFLLVSILAYFIPGFGAYFPYFLALWAIPIGYVIFRYFIRGMFGRFSRESAALLVEEKTEGLENGLINSVQLQPFLKEKQPGSNNISPSFVKELLDRTSKRVETLKPDTLLPSQELFRNRNIFVAALTVLSTLFLFWPNLFSEGFRNLMAPPAEARINPTDDSGSNHPDQANANTSFHLESLKLTFNYPAYTRLKQVTLEPSDGKIQVLPGTEVVVTAKFDRVVKDAELVLNSRDFLSMTAKKNGAFEGRFFAKDNGYYQFRLNTENGGKVLLASQYPIKVVNDQSPTITLMLANPKPVYLPNDKIKMFFEAHDDYGISRIELVSESGGQITRKAIKTVKSIETELKDGFTWELGTMRFEPGAEVRYFLEVRDNDNILGPNTGQSEMFSFEIFDEFKKREDLLVLQEELLEKMIALLANTLLFSPQGLTHTVKGLNTVKRQMGNHTDQLIEVIRLTQTIHEQAKTIGSFPQTYLTLLKNMARNFNGIREDHIQAISRLTDAIGNATPVGLNFPPIESVNQDLVTHLERDILLLVKIINRERMDQVLDLNDDLQSLADQLKEEFEKARDQENALNKPQFKKALEKIRETMQKIMEQLARQTQGMSDEFLNPNAMENLEMQDFKASLEKLMSLVENGQMQKAMQEMENMMKDLQQLSQQLDQMMNDQENLMDIQTVKKLEESLAKVEQLEKEQKGLLEKTAKLNKKLRSKQSQRFEDRLKEFFASLRKDVNQIQTLLRDSGTFLEEHQQMKQLEALMDEENKLKQKIQDLNQKTIDALQDQLQQEKFGELNIAREELSGINQKIQDLRLKMFHGFKTFLPQLKDQYDRLEEFTELQDLHEFDALFKNTYPEIFRWDNHFRTARDARPDLKDRLTADLQEVSRLNTEISKKLGTMRRDLRADYRALITEPDKENLQSMANKQGELKDQSNELANDFRKMQQDNPMVPSILDQKMKGASRNMGFSQSNLKEQNVPESIRAENKALKDLSELKDMLQQMRDGQGNTTPQQTRRMARLGTGRARDTSPGGGSIRMQREKVTLPSEDQYHVPQQFREEILEAMKHQHPRQYEKMVSQYYKELVK
ncbi:MAG: hypothetical protein G3M70_14740 [Candidatus Nitronauta litoralis]|uniref:DUF4175 family protein n=1 Tax=Candidatus Nitronauta litoralis TaxID=2705533 RepID=A0A7T0G1L1_9BACT|nr:MAG: hypothetical protein G3M70_14740 [Candidatus Nitronauta litoralis]